MPLAPIGELIEVKPRPDTTLRLRSAMENPERTVADYVFTPSIKEHVRVMLDNLRGGRGGGYWALSEYGGGKTHFLATLAALLSEPERSLARVSDSEIRQALRSVSGRRLFPVAFNLIGRGDMLGRRGALFAILEDEMRKAARRLLGADIAPTLAEDVSRWWDALGDGTRSDIAEKYGAAFGGSASGEREGAPERWAERISQSAAEMGIRIDVASSPADRIAAAYERVVSRNGEYDGLLIVMDEFASWQDRRPEGGAAYSEDENLLQTLAETLPKERGLNVVVLVASQKPMPRKFEGDRFRQFDILRPAEGSASPYMEYATVVAARVRDIAERWTPEIEEYHDHYRARFDFARRLSYDDFAAIFPMQPLSFDILRRIAANLTTARTGINVLWDALARGDGDLPEIRPALSDMRRLVAARDLLDSDTLRQDLRQSARYGEAYRACEQALEHAERLESRGEISQEDAPIAKAVIRTLFLWRCSRDAHTPMALGEMSEAVAPDEGFLDSPEDALLAALQAMEDIPQIEYDAQKRELSFVAEVTSGKSAADVFSEYRADFDDPAALRARWRELLTDGGMASGFLPPVLEGLETGAPAKRTVVYRGINYDGEALAATEWRAELGGGLPFDSHFRVVFMLEDAAEPTAADIQDRRVLACVPAALSEDNLNALKDCLAIERMREDYALRQDDEALRVNHFINARRSDARNALLRAQRDGYRRGRIASAPGIALDPADLFGNEPDTLRRMAEGLFDAAFADMPIGSFRRGRNMNLNTDANRVFTGLWESEPERAARSALENFAVGLGLARPDNPLKFDPAEGGALDIIRGLHDDAQENGARLPAAAVYENLAQVGIPARLASLYLLCFVRANADVELLLRDGHRLQLAAGGALRENRIVSGVVPLMRWNASAFADGSPFDSLAERQGAVWNDCLAWTRKLVPDLAPAAAAEGVEAETARLMNSLQTERERLAGAESQARILAAGAGGGMPADMERSIDVVRALTASESLDQFMETVGDRGLSRPDDLESVLADVRNLRRLSQSAAEITASRAYLENVSANRFAGEWAGLGEERDALLSAFDFSALVADPDQWRGVSTGFGAWKEAYIREYRKSHRDYHVAAGELRARIPRIRDGLAALANIESAPQIVQSAAAPQLKAELDAVEDALLRCEPLVQASALESAPVCARCGVRLGDMPPDDLSALEARASAALKGGADALRSESADKALAKSPSAAIRDLRAALSEYDAPRIIRALKDAGSGELLQNALAGESGVQIISGAAIIRKLSQEYPAISRESAGEAADRFRELMEVALSERQNAAGDGVTVEIRLG